MNREQELIDIMFEISYMIHARFKDKNYHEEIAPWIITQLNSLGYDGGPVGSSWFVLTKKL